MPSGSEKSSCFLKRIIITKPLWEKNSSCSQCSYLECSLWWSEQHLSNPSTIKRKGSLIKMMEEWRKVVCQNHVPD